MAQQTEDAKAVAQISQDDCLKKAVSLDKVITEHVMMADDEDLTAANRRCDHQKFNRLFVLEDGGQHSSGSSDRTAANYWSSRAVRAR